MRRTQWAATLLGLLLFFFGVAVGALAHRYYTATRVSAKTTAEDYRQRYVSEMRSKLRLTDSQVSQLETILDQTKAKVQAVRDSYHPAMLKIREEQISRVKSILTPEQIPGYEQLIAEHQQRARQQEERDRERERQRAAGHQSATR